MDILREFSPVKVPHGDGERSIMMIHIYLDGVEIVGLLVSLMSPQVALHNAPASSSS